MSAFEKAAIYVDLDSLFDTRLTTLLSMRKTPEEVLKLDVYYTRITDEFEGIALGAYQKAYTNRTTDIVRNAMVTKIPELIYAFIKATLVGIVSSPFRRQPRVVLNTYPYETDEVFENSLLLGLRAITQGLADIEIVSIPITELTPAYVKKHFVEMVMYSYWEWLETQAKLGYFKETLCAGVRLIGPALFKSKEAHKTLLAQGIDELKVFSIIESFSSPYVKLDLVPVSYYCANLDRVSLNEKETK